MFLSRDRRSKGATGGAGLKRRLPETSTEGGDNVGKEFSDSHQLQNEQNEQNEHTMNKLCQSPEHTDRWEKTKTKHKNKNQPPVLTSMLAPSLSS